MNIHQFWAYVGHIDALIPVAGTLVTIVTFLNKAVRKFLAARAGELARLTVTAFTK